MKGRRSESKVTCSL